MKVIQVNSEEAGGKAAFEIFKEALNKGAQVFGLATGSTPKTTYQNLCQSDLDFSNCYSVNLDEYVGLSPEDQQSYHYYMQENLFKQKPFKKSFLPNGLAMDAQAETKRYDQILKDYPIDLQLLGLGVNGHIGFNEPGSSFSGLTSKVALTDSTIKANARFFKDPNEVPRFAYSMGIGSIMQAKQIILEAYGEKKAQAVKALVEGEISTDCPASVLQKHDNVTIIVDEAAASLLTK